MRGLWRARDAGRRWRVVLLAAPWLVALAWFDPSRFVAVAEALGGAAGMWWGLRALHRKGQEGVVLDADGIRIARPGQAERFVRWAEVTRVERRAATWRIEAPGGTLVLRWPRLFWNLDGYRADAYWRKAQAEAAVRQPGDVTPQQIREWLDLGESDAMVGSDIDWQRGCLLAAVWPSWLLAGGLLARLALWSGPWLAPVLWVLLGAWAVSTLGLGASLTVHHGFVATPWGLTVRSSNGNRTVLDWADLLGYTTDQQGHLLRTRRGTVRLPRYTPNLPRLMAAIDRMLAEREAGALLPRLDSGVNPASLSRAAATVSAERGVSRSEA